MGGKFLAMTPRPNARQITATAPTISCLLGLLLLLIGAASGHADSGQQQNDALALKQLQARQHLRVLVTDSGLGGLSVCGDLEKKALKRKVFEKLEILFCNALPEPAVGYNNLSTPQRRAAVFSDALAGMVKTCEPDVILIACNTLSVVYPETEIRKTLRVPVFGIVDMGVDLILAELQKDNSSSVVIFGTETTIAAGSHRAKCLARGIAPTRVVNEPCPDLAAEIQVNPVGEPAQNLIDLYVAEAVGNLAQSNGPIVAAMCCTHFGYCSDRFRQAFAAAGRQQVRIVNPNQQMADLVFPSGTRDRCTNSLVTVKVVSRAALSPEEIQGIGALLEKDSPLTAAALRHYERKPDLFPFQRQ